VDCIVTSPPYWGLRNYGTKGAVWPPPRGRKPCEPTKHDWRPALDASLGLVERRPPSDDAKECAKCGAWIGELGQEPRADLFIEHLCQVFDALRPKLTDIGTLWVVLGDCYLGDRSFAFIPERFALAMHDRGWVCRSRVIWHKPNPVPEPVRDRFVINYESILAFVKAPVKPRFWINAHRKAVTGEKPSSDDEGLDWKLGKSGKKIPLWESRAYYFRVLLQKAKRAGSLVGVKKYTDDDAADVLGHRAASRWKGLRSCVVNPYRNARSVWSISPARYPDAHFAVFPEKLVEAVLSAGCPPRVCTRCGLPVVTLPLRKTVNREGWGAAKKEGGGAPEIQAWSSTFRDGAGRCGDTVVVSKAVCKCSCGAKFRRGRVLDPFFGSGTTGVVARKMGLDFIGIEDCSDFIEIAEKRLGMKKEKTKGGLDAFTAGGGKKK